MKKFLNFIDTKINKRNIMYLIIAYLFFIIFYCICSKYNMLLIHRLGIIFSLCLFNSFFAKFMLSIK